MIHGWSITRSLPLLLLAGALAAEESVEKPLIQLHEILSQTAEKGDATISGVVIKRISPGNYLIHDGTGTLEVDIPHHKLPPGGLLPHTPIRLQGVIQHDENEILEIDVDTIHWSF
ncbi:NirD/YgiW/YdeI family stress tolerance protein [Kistimonas asteriae]|uniref:NirD/YgiW/YdeI family stress tolerance protein n=1 Tax=Kistimonas asteriae TaxID=517724 RepID=UPI001BA6650B|nr:NirD/YgiW/YdeI family stress tolerance protein [Kistimonas asteriae]